jgi:hypothetical protein
MRSLAMECQFDCFSVGGNDFRLRRFRAVVKQTTSLVASSMAGLFLSLTDGQLSGGGALATISSSQAVLVVQNVALSHGQTALIVNTESFRVLELRNVVVNNCSSTLASGGFTGSASLVNVSLSDSRGAVLAATGLGPSVTLTVQQLSLVRVVSPQVSVIDVTQFAHVSVSNFSIVNCSLAYGLFRSGTTSTRMTSVRVVSSQLTVLSEGSPFSRFSDIRVQNATFQSMIGFRLPNDTTMDVVVEKLSLTNVTIAHYGLLSQRQKFSLLDTFTLRDSVFSGVKAGLRYLVDTEWGNDANGAATSATFLVENVTIVDCPDVSFGGDFGGANVTLRRLELRNGGTLGLFYAKSVSISNLLLTGHTCNCSDVNPPPVIYAVGCKQLLMRDSVLRDNLCRCNQTRRLFYALQSGTVTLQSCLFERNDFRDGIFFSGEAIATNVTETRFIANRAYDVASMNGIPAGGSFATFDRVTFVGNNGSRIAAITVAQVDLRLTRSQFIDNVVPAGLTADNLPAVIHTYFSSVTLDSCEIRGNTVVFGVSNIVFSTARVSNCAFVNNTAGSRVLSFDRTNGTSRMENVTFTNNTVPLSGTILSASLTSLIDVCVCSNVGKSVSLFSPHNDTVERVRTIEGVIFDQAGARTTATDNCTVPCPQRVTFEATTLPPRSETGTTTVKPLETTAATTIATTATNATTATATTATTSTPPLSSIPAPIDVALIAGAVGGSVGLLLLIGGVIACVCVARRKAPTTPDEAASKELSQSQYMRVPVAPSAEYMQGRVLVSNAREYAEGRFEA